MDASAAGEYRLRWVIGCDGDNILRLTNTNDATITPSEFAIPAGAGDGELHFTVEEDCEDFKIEFEFAAGTYMDIYQVKLYTPDYQTTLSRCSSSLSARASSG